MVDPGDGTGVLVDGVTAVSLTQVDPTTISADFTPHNVDSGSSSWEVHSPSGITPDLEDQAGGVD